MPDPTRATPDPPERIDLALRWARARLTTAGELQQSDPTAHDGDGQHRLDAELLVMAATGRDRSALFAWPEHPLTDPERACLRGLLARREQGEPMAYILGQREFWSLTLKISPATLIPRPETELLVDWALARHNAESRIDCADLGTGSGAIALALANERPNWRIVAVDRSAAALAMAAANKQQLDAPLVALLQSDWLTAIDQRTFDLILANPPYVAERDPHLSQGDLRFEPRLALAAGADGLGEIRRIAATLASHLRPDGWCAIEHGWDQGQAVRQLLHAAGLDAISTQRDLAGLERFTTARRPAADESAHSPTPHPLNGIQLPKRPPG